VVLEPVGSVGMRTIGLLGVPTNSAGRFDGVARGPIVLREEGLVDALHGHVKVHDYGDLTLPDPSSTRASRSRVIDPDGLDALVARVRDAVAPILDNGHLPLVIGGDCPLLLGCLAASSGRDRVGLLFVDGHEDAYLPVQSSTGEAADMELAFALGMADASWSPELSNLLPLVAPTDVRILGARDAELLRAEGVASLRELVLAKPTQQLREFMTRDLVFVAPTDDQEIAARLIAHYDFLALPVVQDGRILGLITVDDIIDVLISEGTEDQLRFGAVEPGVLNQPYFTTPIWRVVRSRVGWLVLLFVAETATGTVLRHFEDELARVGTCPAVVGSRVQTLKLQRSSRRLEGELTSFVAEKGTSAA